MIKLYKQLFIWVGLIVTCFLSINSAQGPAFLYATGATGAPFDGGNHCSNLCHNSGNLYNTLVTVQLFDGTTLVTEYTPGHDYTVRITITGNPLPAGVHYGFQIAASTTDAPNYTNINTWGSDAVLTGLDMHNQLLNGRNYVEHSTPFTSNVIDIPWTAPTAGTGAITFYGAGNIVDFSGGSGNDQANAGSLTVAESTLPVKWLYFKGKTQDKKVLLEWGTAEDKSVAHFIIEKSTEENGHFTVLTKVTPVKDAEAEHHYRFTDSRPLTHTYYRISQKELDGHTYTYRTVHITAAADPKNFHYIQEGNVVLSIGVSTHKEAVLYIYDISGRYMSNSPITLEAGINKISIPKPEVQGTYILDLMAPGEQLYKEKLIIQ